MGFIIFLAFIYLKLIHLKIYKYINNIIHTCVLTRFVSHSTIQCPKCFEWQIK